MTEHTLPAEQPRLWREYLELCKPKVVLLLIFTAIVGMCLATPGIVPLNALLFGTVGIGLAAAAGAAINHVVDQRADRLMARTRARPVATGRIDDRSALFFACAMAVVAMVILVLFVNTITAVLTFASMIGYSVVYTMFLKRMTPQNIVIGGAAGAMPPVLGWTAVTGSLDSYALLLFLIVFAWTPPHFWALAIHRYREYALADIPMLPVTHGVDYTRLQILLYTIILIVVSFLPFVTGMSGPMYFAGAVFFGAGFLFHAMALHRDRDDAGLPMKTFGYSITYLMGLFTALLIDHYMPY